MGPLSYLIHNPQGNSCADLCKQNVLILSWRLLLLHYFPISEIELNKPLKNLTMCQKSKPHGRCFETWRRRWRSSVHKIGKLLKCAGLATVTFENQFTNLTLHMHAVYFTLLYNFKWWNHIRQVRNYSEVYHAEGHFQCQEGSYFQWELECPSPSAIDCFTCHFMNINIPMFCMSHIAKGDKSINHLTKTTL